MSRISSYDPKDFEWTALPEEPGTIGRKILYWLVTTLITVWFLLFSSLALAFICLSWVVDRISEARTAVRARRCGLRTP